MAVKARLTPTLFDRLVCDLSLSGLRDPNAPEPHQPVTEEASLEVMRYYQVADPARFNERALRANIRRELAWLLNTTNLESTTDLTDYPRVATSVLNYGVPDLAGKSLDQRTIQRRARDIRQAIHAFEPRVDKASLKVEPTGSEDDLNTIVFTVHGDITAAHKALPVKFRTRLDVDSAAVDVFD